MSFKVQGPSRVVQFPGDGASTYYVGQLVAFSTTSKAMNDGAVSPLIAPAGVADTTADQVIAGVVVGFNNRTPTYDATYKANTAGGTLTAQSTQLARDWALNKGMYAIGDPQLLIDVAMIDSTTLLEGPIYNAAYGTAPTVATASATETDGWKTASTSSATDFTNVDGMGTWYCRTGANAGLYRTNVNTTTTDPAVFVAFPYDVVTGDTFVSVPVKQGLSFIYTTTGMFIDCSKPPGTNYFEVICEKLDLSKAGSEKALFRFNTVHFSFTPYRIAT